MGLILYTAGLAIAIIGRIELGKNWANIEDYQVLHEQKLVDKGMYRLIRHPIYSGDILLIFGLELALNLACSYCGTSGCLCLPASKVRRDDSCAGF